MLCASLRLKYLMPLMHSNKRFVVAHVRTFEPKEEMDANGRVIRSGIHTYGDTVHIFVERKDYKGVFLPGYEAHENDYAPQSNRTKVH